MKTGGDKALVEPPTIALSPSSNDAAKGLSRLEVALVSKKPAVPMKEASMASTSGPAISAKLVVAFDDADGMLGQFCSTFWSADDLAKSSCHVGGPLFVKYFC